MGWADCELCKSCTPSWGLCSPGCAHCSGDLHLDPKVQYYSLWVFFFFFGLIPVAYCMFSDEGLNAHTLHWKGGILATGPPGKSTPHFLNTFSKNSGTRLGPSALHPVPLLDLGTPTSSFTGSTEWGPSLLKI